MAVGATDSDGLDLNQYLSHPWRGNWAFLYANVVRRIEERCLILHLLHLLEEQIRENLRRS